MSQANKSESFYCVPSNSQQGRVLIVAGSDPTAGAGLQADLKSVTALGGYAMTVVSAITVQNTRKVFRVDPLPADLVAGQLRACLEDIGADCIKLGMLSTCDIVAVVTDILTTMAVDIPVVADPVFAGTKGGILLDLSGQAYFIKHFLPRVTLLTPNLDEAGLLTGMPVTNLTEMAQAAKRLLAMGAKSVLVKGGHLEGGEVIDLLDTGDAVYHFRGSRLEGVGCHGTGCTLASAIATGLALGKSLPDSVSQGHQYVRKAIQNSRNLGKGQKILG